MQTITSGFMINFYKTGTEFRTRAFVHARIDLLNKYFETFSAAYYSIMDIAKTNDLDNRYFGERFYSEIKCKYVEVISKNHLGFDSTGSIELRLLNHSSIV